MVPIARRNLLAEKGRFAISIAGVAFAVLLILIVLALYRGFSGSGGTLETLPGELWIVQEGTTNAFQSTSLVRREQLEPARSLEGVAAVIPVLSRLMAVEAGGGEESATLMALDVPEGLPLSDDLRERFLPEQGAIVIDRTFARKTGLDAGGTVTVAGEPLTVERVVPAGAEALIQFAFVNYADAERLFALEDVVNYGLVVLAPGADEGTVAAAIAQGDPGLRVFTAHEFATAIRKEIDESFLPVITILLGIGFVVGAAVVGLTIYTATIERSREFAVMKAVGGSPAFLYRIVLSQSAMLTAAGFVIGLGAALLVARLASDVVPEFVTEFQLLDVLGVLGAAAGMALGASFVPASRINRIDPAMVFRA